VVAFIEQVQNIDKSNASVVEVVSCFATDKARIQERQSDVHIKPSRGGARGVPGGATASPKFCLAPPVAPPNENVWLRP